MPPLIIWDIQNRNASLRFSKCVRLWIAFLVWLLLGQRRSYKGVYLFQVLNLKKKLYVLIYQKLHTYFILVEFGEKCINRINFYLNIPSWYQKKGRKKQNPLHSPQCLFFPNRPQQEYDIQYCYYYKLILKWTKFCSYN